ncbi:Hypothetical_protein [Hexamita inflata]|uniref:Hypothetical_protein n=1 Tax=Hexamita inflata TaxID=28002 RepID=A0AA86Q1Z5_9EUKA|nr:Hypothetical protein HINF_LOCUS35757 [Hexamita inflata]CAI9948123.1 Hypothetical protein HINF_LOCUS35768 [Hexamita inflata]
MLGTFSNLFSYTIRRNHLSTREFRILRPSSSKSYELMSIQRMKMISFKSRILFSSVTYMNQQTIFRSYVTPTYFTEVIISLFQLLNNVNIIWLFLSEENFKLLLIQEI